MHESLFVLTVQRALCSGLMGARDLIIDSVPILDWRRADPDAAYGHAPAQHPRPLLRSFRVHTLICRGSGLPLFFLLSPANVHDASFAQPLLAWAVQLYQIPPRFIRLNTAYWGLKLILSQRIAVIYSSGVSVLTEPSKLDKHPFQKERRNGHRCCFWRGIEEDDGSLCCSCRGTDQLMFWSHSLFWVMLLQNIFSMSTVGRISPCKRIVMQERFLLLPVGSAQRVLSVPLLFDAEEMN